MKHDMWLNAGLCNRGDWVWVLCSDGYYFDFTVKKKHMVPLPLNTILCYVNHKLVVYLIGKTP